MYCSRRHGPLSLNESLPLSIRVLRVINTATTCLNCRREVMLLSTSTESRVFIVKLLSGWSIFKAVSQLRSEVMAATQALTEL